MAGKKYKNLYWFLQSAWLGQACLWQVFWPFFLLVNAVLFYIDYRIANVTYTIASWKTVHGMLFCQPFGGWCQFGEVQATLPANYGRYWLEP